MPRRAADRTARPAGIPQREPVRCACCAATTPQGQIIGGRHLEVPEDAPAAFDTALGEAFADPQMALVHVRAVEYGCFHFEVRRP